MIIICKCDGEYVFDLSAQLAENEFGLSQYMIRWYRKSLTFVFFIQSFNFRVDLLYFVEHKDMFQKESDRLLKIKRSESAYPPMHCTVSAFKPYEHLDNICVSILRSVL